MGAGAFALVMAEEAVLVATALARVIAVSVVRGFFWDCWVGFSAGGRLGLAVRDVSSVSSSVVFDMSTVGFDFMEVDPTGGLGFLISESDSLVSWSMSTWFGGVFLAAGFASSSSLLSLSPLSCGSWGSWGGVSVRPSSSTGGFLVARCVVRLRVVVEGDFFAGVCCLAMVGLW